MSLPTITATGNLAADPDLKFTQSGKPALNFRIGCNENKRDEAGQWQTVSTTWLGVTLWGDDAERYADLLHKGDQVMVTGQLTVREYDRTEGTKGTAVEVKFARVGVISTKSAAQPQQTAQSNPWGGQPAPQGGSSWDAPAGSKAPF